MENKSKKKSGIVKEKKEKKKNIIARHKLLFLICLLAFIILIVMFYIFFSLFIGGNDPYGNRLKGINSVKISSKEKKEVASFLTEKDEIVDSLVRVQGKVVYVHIKLKEGIGLDRAKEIAQESLGKFSDKEKKFYDFEYFLYEEKDDGYVVIGNKNVRSESLVWIKS